MKGQQAVESAKSGPHPLPTYWTCWWMIAGSAINLVANGVESSSLSVGVAVILAAWAGVNAAKTAENRAIITVANALELAARRSGLPTQGTAAAPAVAQPRLMWFEARPELTKLLLALLALAGVMLGRM